MGEGGEESIDIMRTEDRLKYARESLGNDNARLVFDKLVAAFPDAAVFWMIGEEKNEVEFGLYPKAEKTCNVSTVTIRLWGEWDDGKP